MRIGARRASARTVELWCEDSGPGIPDGQEHALFNQYVQLNIHTYNRDAIVTPHPWDARHHRRASRACGLRETATEGSRHQADIVRMPYPRWRRLSQPMAAAVALEGPLGHTDVEGLAQRRQAPSPA